MNVRREWLPGEMEDAQRIGLVFAKRPWPGFAAAVREYRQIEADLIARGGIEGWYLLELKRRIAEWIVMCADRDDVPLEQMQEAWDDLVALGFTDEFKKRDMVFIYADYCLSHEHYDAPLELVEPVIAEFDAWLQRTVVVPPMKQIYEDHLHNLKFVRDGLIALRAGGAEAEAWLALDEARQNSP
jgi:hypothetical protein